MPEQTFALAVLSPQGVVFRGAAKAVSLPTPAGKITVLARHAPLVAALADGEIHVATADGNLTIAVAGGFVEVAGNEVTVLSDYAAEAESIEIARVEAAKKRAEDLLKEKVERRDLALVERDLRRAILQLKVAEKARKRRERPMEEPRHGA